MFTGIVLMQGTIKSFTTTQNEKIFTIEVPSPLDLTSGASIAINGVCLTVEKYQQKNFTVYVSPTTLSVTNLGLLTTGNTVNLEKPLTMADPLGGHFVTGHVDCIAKVLNITQQGKAHHITLTFPQEYDNEVVSKGSVALDGISLTITDCQPGILKVTIIPKTWDTTNISLWTIGTQINMETDILGKYIHKALAAKLVETNKQHKKSNITEHFLHEHGFF